MDFGPAMIQTLFKDVKNISTNEQCIQDVNIMLISRGTIPTVDRQVWIGGQWIAKRDFVPSQQWLIIGVRV